MLATEIDLQAWCGTGEGNWLSKPFVRGGFRCATDGSAMVRLPAPEEPETENPATWMPLPDTQNVFAPVGSLAFAPWPADWESWEVREIEGEKAECPECHGETKECGRCDGFGQIECGECEQDYDCPECKGKGYIGEKCAKCGSRGTIAKPGRAFHLAPGAWVNERFLRRVVDLPNLRWANQGADKPVFFRFDGGEAAIMPITPPLPED
ncbi:MAG TPA: hypothetical protein VMY35_14840 [Phycisphaerae bacterium]|nr:hypothetical protein [Phycisphaerae bacterium]